MTEYDPTGMGFTLPQGGISVDGPNLHTPAAVLAGLTLQQARILDGIVPVGSSVAQQAADQESEKKQKEIQEAFDGLSNPDPEAREKWAAKLEVE